MDRTTLEGRLQKVEDLVQRMAQKLAFQREMIATLDRGGHDLEMAKRFLRRLEAMQAKHLADRDRLFQQLANNY